MERTCSEMQSSRRVSLDWTRIGIGLSCAVLIAAALTQVGPEPVSTGLDRTGGLRVLADHEQLVSFEDFSFGARGWETEGADGGAGHMLGPFDFGSIGKRFTLPEDTDSVAVTFDLRLMDGWSGEGLTVSVNGARVIDSVTPVRGRPDATRVFLQPQGGPGDGATWAVRIEMRDPGDALTLRLETTGGDRASWAIDNLSVVAAES